MAEIEIDKLRTVKDKVFFPGTAVLSDKEIESLKKDVAAEASEGEAEVESDKKAAKKGK